MNCNVNMNPKDIIEDLSTNTCIDLPMLLDRLQELIKPKVSRERSLPTEIIDMELLQEIRSYWSKGNLGNTWLGFGKSMRDIKCVIHDDEGLRQHEVFLDYRAPKKLVISSTNLPHSPLLTNEYTSIEDAVLSLKKYIDDLSAFFYELENIDRRCTVMEPLKPTFKDDYRRILLDDRTWLHVEVTRDGLGTNIHLVGQSDFWNDKLQAGLITWDHDQSIVDNIMTVFDILEFPIPGRNSPSQLDMGQPAVAALVCSICLCSELPDSPALPQPLCRNSACSMNFHRNCLFQWLVACAGNRPPAFGVITGACPTCLQPITCSEKDS